MGIELSTYQFQHTNKEKISFYTFGSGEYKVTVDDVRVVKGRPTVTCSGELIKVRILSKLNYNSCGGGKMTVLTVDIFLSTHGC